jgi:archaeosortase C (PEF-CTERM variant)
MDEKHHNVILIILALSLFLGATVQYSEGSNLLGIVLFIMGVGVLSRIKMGSATRVTLGHAKFYSALGLLLIILDIGYNFLGQGRGEIKTLDTMVILLGASLMAWSSPKGELKKLGAFGTYLSVTFVFLFLTFYIALNHQLYKFDHYLVMLPSAYIVKTLGVPIYIVGTETLRLGGSDLVVKIGGPCSGLYSMFLLMGIVLGFSASEEINGKKRIAGLAVVAAAVAYVGNLVRVSVIYIVGNYYGSDAMMTVHVHLGWMLFAGTSLAILYALEKTRAMLNASAR